MQFGQYVGSRVWRAVLSASDVYTRLTGKKARPYLYGLAMVALLIFTQARETLVAFAATATPVPPTATLVPLVIPINSIFTQANSWISTLSPIASIGIGVMIALAVFGFLASAIKSAFG